MAELRALLDGTVLAGSEVALDTVADTQEHVFAIKVPTQSILAWNQLRDRLQETGRWPVLTLLRSSDSRTWAEQVKSSDIFSRFYFLEEDRGNRRSDSPDAILQASKSLDPLEELARLGDDESVSLDEYVSICHEDTESRFGKGPEGVNSPSFLQEHSLHSQEAIERWFFEWELSNCPDPLALPEYGLSHISWYEPVQEQTVLLLMPTPNGWDVPAYINWFASQGCNSQLIVALLRHWNLCYGAELVAHYGTMLQFNVRHRPQTAQEAFQLAWQQYTIAQCTTILPGVSPRDHARALLHSDRWFLHERP